jgi:hypothetical protein
MLGSRALVASNLQAWKSIAFSSARSGFHTSNHSLLSALKGPSSRPPLSQKVKFIDQLRVEVQGGNGGDGASALFGRTGR